MIKPSTKFGLSNDGCRDKASTWPRHIWEVAEYPCESKNGRAFAVDFVVKMNAAAIQAGHCFAPL